MRTLDELKKAIAVALDADAPRALRTASNNAAAARLSSRLPLVHRAPGPGALAEIFAAGCVGAPEPCTARETACGIPAAAYFFLGCAAYPTGTVVFLAAPDVLLRLPASFTPFDTGALTNYVRLRDTGMPWNDADRTRFLAAHLGRGADAAEFAAAYIASHFGDVRDYVRRPQKSLPDEPTYHGLESTTGDRRAWTIEVQVHADLPADDAHLQNLVLAQSDQITDAIPDDLVERVVIAENDEIEAAVCGVILAEVA